MLSSSNGSSSSKCIHDSGRWNGKPGRQVLVIGAGLPRTGTLSMQAALQHLLGGHCCHGYDISRKDWQEGALWYRAATAGMTRQLAEVLYKDYVAAVDIPAVGFYKDLVEIYPEAKVVLTVRPPAEWAASMQATVLSTQRHSMRVWPMSFVRKFYKTVLTVDILLERLLGVDYLDLDDAALMQRFRLHSEAVRRSVPQHRLLEFNVADGWKPLCEFLDLPVPDTPFPSGNDTEQYHRQVLKIRMQHASIAFVTVTLMISIVVAIVYKLFG